uniref:Uncharacterized protein n=1 Tax=Anguilla anguilla TaxID=7936 RepID=A0A0E9RN59_ANGAN
MTFTPVWKPHIRYSNHTVLSFFKLVYIL